MSDVREAQLSLTKQTLICKEEEGAVTMLDICTFVLQLLLNFC